MFWGRVRSADGSLTAIESVDELSGIDPSGRTLWIDLECPDEPQLQAIGKFFNLDQHALEDCLTGEQRPRVDEFSEHLFIVTYGVLGPETDSEYSLRKIAIFFGEDYIITTHREPLRTINRFRRHDEKYLTRMLQRGTDFVLYNIIDSLVDNYVLISQNYENRLENLDDQALNPTGTSQILEELSDIRGHLIDLRQITFAQQELLLPFARGDYDYVSENLEKPFRHVLDHVRLSIELLEGNRELVNSVRDNYRSVQAEQMNSVMKTLTMIATITMPLSLLAGIYGMNLMLWPDPGNPVAFWVLLVTMAVIVIGMIAFFRYRKWL